MRNENKSSSYPEINTRKRELCAPYKPLPFIDERAQKYKNMKKSNLNTILLIIIIVLLIICAYGIYSRPTLEQIDERIMHWGQHFGAVFSN